MLKLEKKEDNRKTRQQLVSRSGEPLLWAFTASTALQRLKGLFAYPSLDNSQALILSPCSAVHTVALGYTIDVAFLCAEGRILKTGTLKPWRLMMCFRGKYVIEMAEGTVCRLNLQVGQQLDVWSDIVDVFCAADQSDAVDALPPYVRELQGGFQ